MLGSTDNTDAILETADFAMFSKPAGIETVSLDGHPDFLSLLRRVRDEPGLAAAHRLDRDTSGLQVFARTAEAEERLVDLFRRRLVGKTYLAICLGVPRNASGGINRRLSEWRGGRRPVAVVKKGGLEAGTDYRVLAASGELDAGFRISLVAFRPRQGRTHQIRVHAAAFGYPILGDDQYGDRSANRFAREAWGLRRQALHSRRLSLPWNGTDVAAAAPLAEDMAAVTADVWGMGGGGPFAGENRDS